MDDKEIMIESLQSTIKRMRKAHENDQSALAAYRIETMDLGTKLSALRNTLRGQGKKPVFIIENPELCGGFLFLEAFLEHENQSVPLKNSDHPTRDSVTLPALFRAEKFGISATAPGYDPTGDGSAYQPAAEPAPGSDAAHPPLGYRLEPVGGVRREWYIWWDPSGRWREGTQLHVGDIVYDGSIIANPIPSADGDSHACAEIARLRAIPDLIRKRYPRMLERGNPLFDGVLADLLERCNNSSASAQQGVVVVPEYPIRDGNDGWANLINEWVREWTGDSAKFVPSSRVLRDGEVAVDARELQGLRDFADGWNSFREQFDDIAYHYQGMGCGIEDRGIHDRYQACEYGWESAMERVAERFPEIDTLDALRSQEGGV